MSDPSDSHLPILLVEDDPLVLEATAELLADGGCAVRRASNAEEALAALDDGPLPAVLVTDISLASDRSGLELARTVAERWPQVKLLIVSGACRPPPEEYPDGALFFTKPYAGGALLRMVKGEDW
jgi:CheY-like chemotaxis protein